MWYTYLRRDQAYLRSYRTHNLWLNMYAENMRTPKISSLHIAFFKKMAKSYSGVSLIDLIEELSSNMFCLFLATYCGLLLGFDSILCY